MHTTGLRIIELKKNKLGSPFMIQFQRCVEFDRYLKSVDLSHNTIGYDEIKRMLKKKSLFENNNLLSLDLRFNPGATPKILKNVALQLLKNLQLLQASG